MGEIKEVVRSDRGQSARMRRLTRCGWYSHGTALNHRAPYACWVDCLSGRTISEHGRSNFRQLQADDVHFVILDRPPHGGASNHSSCRATSYRGCKPSLPSCQVGLDELRFFQCPCPHARSMRSSRSGVGSRNRRKKSSDRSLCV